MNEKDKTAIPDFGELLRQQELERKFSVNPQLSIPAVTSQIPEFIPFMISGTTPEQLATCFDGPVPVIGDRVELVCYGMVGNSRMFKWRVIKEELRIP